MDWGYGSGVFGRTFCISLFGQTSHPEFEPCVVFRCLVTFFCGGRLLRMDIVQNPMTVAKSA